MTLRQVVQGIEAAAWRHQQIERASIVTAWYAAAFVGQAMSGKLGKLEEYLPDDGAEEGPVEMAPEQEELMWQLLATPVEP